MKHLKSRSDFLLESKKVYKFNTNDVKDSVLIKEVFENEITWGGSLLGRLINSTIRRFKIGYNQVKVDPLLKKLEDELNYLISASIQGDTLKKYNDLQVRSLIEEIKDICESPKTDEDKLDELLGGHSNLYDPNKPNVQRTHGIVQKVLDIITDDLKDLKKIIGIQRDELIDTISDLNDELRKLTSSTAVSATVQSSRTGFNLNFQNVLNSLISHPQLISDNYNILLSYDIFLERIDAKKLEDNIRERERQLTEHDYDDVTRKGLENELKVLKSKLDKLKGENTQLVKYSGKQPGQQKGKQSSQSQFGKQSDQPGQTGSTQQKDGQSANKDNQQRDLQAKNQVEKGDDEKIGEGKPIKSGIKELINEVLEILKNLTEEEAKKNEKVKSLLSQLKSKSNPQWKNIKVKYDNSEISISDAIEKLSMEVIKESAIVNDIFVNKYMVFESAFVTGAGGSAGGSASSSGSSSTGKKSVRDVWESFNLSKVQKLTQREVDELNSMLSEGTDKMSYDPAKRPDPIVSIARIFGEAHNLYFNPVIPSGRPNGRISQKTYREYIKLGKGDRVDVPTENSGPGYGPWAVKSIFSKWKTGVEKLLQNQEYRKVLSNIKFVVPGAEDAFNKANDSYEYKINEAEGSDTKSITSDLSHGQILFQFINDMLDKNKLDDFDTLRSTLMNKYFGLKSSEFEKKLQPVSKGNANPSKEDFEANVIYFSSLGQDTKIKMGNDKPMFYAIPIKKYVDANSKTHDVLFIQIVERIAIGSSNAFIIKFTYDNPIIMKKYHEKAHDRYKYTDWKVRDDNRIYYGIIKQTAPESVNISNNAFIKIAYGNVNGNPDTVNDVYANKFTVESGRRLLKNGEEINMSPSKLVFNDNNKVNEIKQSPNFNNVKISNNDKEKHIDNLSKNVISKNKTLKEALIDLFEDKNSNDTW